MNVFFANEKRPASLQNENNGIGGQRNGAKSAKAAYGKMSFSKKIIDFCF